MSAVERIYVLPKDSLDPMVKDILDTAKQERPIKDLYSEKRGHKRSKLYSYLRHIYEQKQKKHEKLDNDFNNLAISLISSFKKKTNNGHWAIHLKLNKKMINETFCYYELEIKVKK